MAHLLNVENVTVTVAARTILDGVSLGLDDGARVGVVGRNGDGKSTLLRVLAGRQQPDAGRVTHAGGLRIGFLDQHDDRGRGQTVRQAVVGDAPDHVWASDPRVREVLSGLLGDWDSRPSVRDTSAVASGFDTQVSELSGGQRRRVALAAVLVGDHDLVVLDEPTNHLDVEGVAWLAHHLRIRWPSSKGGLVVVTHDRWFLDAVCENTWEVHDGAVDSYEGGYAAYVLARAERARVEATTAERRANLLRKELAWLRRGAPARTSKPRFRLDAAAALIADEPAPRNDVELQRMASARLGKDVVDLEDVSYSVRQEDGTGRALLDGVTWRLGPGDRFGVVGVNGSGKTTLLRLVAGDIEPDSGRVRRGSTVRVAMLSQELHELDPVAHLRVLEVVERERRSLVVGDREVSAGQLVERLGFTRERAWTPVRELSGGERRRLQLVRLLVHEPNLLLLDEPTNDLDTDTLAAVEDLLDGFAGTLLVVSHDRYLLERVSDRQVALLGDGHLRDLPGGVDEYLRLREALEEGRREASSPAGRVPAGGAAPDGASATPHGDSATPDAAQVRAARKEMARLERQLSRLAERETRLHHRLTERATDHEAVLALDAELRAVHAEREQVEEAWLAAAEVAG